ncbi:CinA family protein [Glaciihabitans sp. dw_435]|uniref:CinA family protein n=1 Tax=Glaciihabitans sp. dw_435 TaxID=2720081 RepID=UPI001BD6ABFB|nr:nicotinamide-nucleotide amidohydrolase family protein [Glaciihabitans sp. dw_435]
MTAAPVARADVPHGDIARELVAELTRRHLTIAVAESLTGGLLVAELVRVPGASAVLNGGLVAYNTELKHTLLGVDASVLSAHGPVHPDVAAQMAAGVRERLAVRGETASVGISTTGVAGPGPSDGHPAGTVFVGASLGGESHILSLSLEGSRDEIRSAVVSESLAWLKTLVFALV